MSQHHIRISHKNPRYWSVNDQTTLLIGGSREDNLFQCTGEELIAHLDEMQAIGANYVRCTMSARDPGDVQPHGKNSDTGLYDLNFWGVEYWRRLDFFLAETDKRGIIVQVELWDRFDFSRAFWLQNSFHPDNNCSYGAEEIGFEREYPDHPLHNKQPFFFSVPALQHKRLLLRHQHDYINKLLSHCFAYEHLLYCIDNETTADPAWGAYWARFIQDAARKIGKTIYCTEMWDDHDIRSDMHKRSIQHPELYQFLDFSQNTHVEGQAHWDHLIHVSSAVQPARPINNVKIYGGAANTHKDSQHAEECFWRGIFAGQASARFHRPPIGLGLSELASMHLRSMRSVEACFSDFFKGKAQPSILQTQANNAFAFGVLGSCMAIVNLQAAAFSVDCSSFRRPELRCLDIRRHQWLDQRDCYCQVDLRHAVFSIEPQSAFLVFVVTECQGLS